MLNLKTAKAVRISGLVNKMKIVCKKCGTKDNSNRWAEKEYMETNQLCYGCTVWHVLIKDMEHLVVIFYEGHKHVYGIGSEDASYKGFNGQKWLLKFKGGSNPGSGNLLRTTNLRYVGQVPDVFEEDFIVNCEALTRE